MARLHEAFQLGRKRAWIEIVHHPHPRRIVDHFRMQLADQGVLLGGIAAWAIACPGALQARAEASADASAPAAVGYNAATRTAVYDARGHHVGEVKRNPYHLLAPARMMDNVRRGSEVVGGQGAAAQSFPFAELYRVTFMRGREIVDPRPGGVIVGPTEKIDPASLAAKFLPRGNVNEVREVSGRRPDGE